MKLWTNKLKKVRVREFLFTECDFTETYHVISKMVISTRRLVDYAKLENNLFKHFFTQHIKLLWFIYVWGLRLMWEISWCKHSPSMFGWIYRLPIKYLQFHPLWMLIDVKPFCRAHKWKLVKNTLNSVRSKLMMC